jgi:hypothetical protein
MLLEKLKTPAGVIVLSIILGLGLASLFRQACIGVDCNRFIAPSIKKLKDKVFKTDDTCYAMTERMVTCDATKKVFDFE